MPTVVVPPRALASRAAVLLAVRSHSQERRATVASTSRPARHLHVSKKRAVIASVVSLEPATDAVQLEADWEEADRDAEARGEEFDAAAAKPKVICFRVNKTLDLAIKEPLGPDWKTPKWAIENYMANPDNFVAMIYPPECVEKSDQYHYKIRLAKIGFLKYQIVPIYRLEMRFLPERGLLARSWDVTLDQDFLPALLKGIDLSMRMRSLTKVHRVSDEVEEFDSDGSIVAYRKTLLEADVNLEIATYLPKVLRVLPGINLVGNGILETILVAIQGILREKMQEDYLRLLKEQKEQE